MQKKIVYIAHPIGGDVNGNLEKLKSIYRRLTLENNIIPFIPYMATVQSLSDENPLEREFGFQHNKAIFDALIINELWLFGDQVSKGMAIEISWAVELGIPIVSMLGE